MKLTSESTANEMYVEILRLQERCKRQRLELRRLNKIQKHFWQGIKYSIVRHALKEEEK